jgi:DNA-binding transcriptional LysR family regulator
VLFRSEAIVRLKGPIRTNSGEAMVPALCAGLGIAVLPGFIVDRHIAEGRLVTILQEWTRPDPVGLHLLSPPGSHRPARVERLIDFLSQRFRKLCAA